MKDRHWIYWRGRKIRVTARMQRVWQKIALRLFGSSMTSTEYGEAQSATDAVAAAMREEGVV